MTRKLHFNTQRRVQAGEDFPHDRKVVVAVPHKHAALAKMLTEESNRKRAVLAEFVRSGPMGTGAKAPFKRSGT